MLEGDISGDHIHGKYFESIDGTVVELSECIWVVIGVRFLLEDTCFISGFNLSVNFLPGRANNFT